MSFRVILGSLGSVTEEPSISSTCNFQRILKNTKIFHFNLISSVLYFYYLPNHKNHKIFNPDFSQREYRILGQQQKTNNNSILVFILKSQDATFWILFYTFQKTKYDAVHNLVHFAQFKKKTCNFTNSSTPPWVFLRFLNCTNGTKSRKAAEIICHSDSVLVECNLPRFCEKRKTNPTPF